MPIGPNVFGPGKGQIYLKSYIFPIEVDESTVIHSKSRGVIARGPDGWDVYWDNSRRRPLSASQMLRLILVEWSHGLQINMTLTKIRIGSFSWTII